MGILDRYRGRKEREALSLTKRHRGTVTKSSSSSSISNSNRNPWTQCLHNNSTTSLRTTTLSKKPRSIVTNNNATLPTNTMMTGQSATAADFSTTNKEEEKKQPLLVSISLQTANIIQKEVMELLQSTSNHTCSVLNMANTLSQSTACKNSHAKQSGAENGGKTFGNMAAVWKGITTTTNCYVSWVRNGKHEKEAMSRRYEWTNALHTLERMPESREKMVSSWDEAMTSLKKVLKFPDDDDEEDASNTGNNVVARTSGTAAQVVVADNKDPIESKYARSHDMEMNRIQESVQHVHIGSGWRRVVSVADELLKEATTDEDLELWARQSKADLHFNARIRDARELDNALRQTEAVKQLEERRKLKEAKERALELLRPLSRDERQIVKEAMYGHGPSDEIIAQSGSDSVLRRSMQTLQPGQWLNDEVIHYFLVMLANRDEELCRKDPNKKRTHFFKSFFVTKLLNEGNDSCDGQYDYNNVKRWSKKVPGKDIFALDKIIFPVNMGNMHWICVVVFMSEKRIQVYDSMGSSGKRYLQAIFHYLQDEHKDKKKVPMPNVNQWELVSTTKDTPQQRNGYDCGVFVCMFADFVSKDTPLLFHQEHICQCRDRIALSIMNGTAIM